MARNKVTPLQTALQQHASIQSEIIRLEEQCRVAGDRLDALEAEEKKQADEEAEDRRRYQKPEVQREKSPERVKLETELDKLVDAVTAAKGKRNRIAVDAEIVRSALQTVESLHKDIAGLDQLATQTEERLATLEAEADLDSETAIADIVRLQAIKALIPGRREARNRTLAQVESELQLVTGKFIQTTLGARVRQLDEQALVQVRGQIQSLFEGLELDRAIENAALVREIRFIGSMVKMQSNFDDTVEHAERMLQALAQAEEFAEKLSSNTAESDGVKGEQAAELKQVPAQS